MTAFTIERESALSAWGQIQRDLRHRIDGGEFAAGERIQPEVELSEHYGVSRVTIRRSIRALIDDGYLRTRPGSGTYVTERTVGLVCELDLARPWKEQLLIDGHDARSLILESGIRSTVPSEIADAFGRGAPTGALGFTRTVHSVEDVPIGFTDSWRTDLWATEPAEGAAPGGDALVAECFAEIGFATRLDTQILRSYVDIPLIVVVARTHFAETGTIAEYARTSWLASRVKLAYKRDLTVDELDITHPDTSKYGSGPNVRT